MPRLAPFHSLSLLLLVTALFTFLIQSGELGTSDTTHRLQVTHSLWTGQPQVFPDEYPEFGVHGRGGHLYAWYGIGQSLLMIPADLVGTAANHLPLWSDYAKSQTDPAIRSIVVSITINIFLNVLTALAAFHLLSLCGFSTAESVAGTLGLLCATTHLHYAQNMTENNYILLLTITGFALQYRWLRTGGRRALFWGSAALGLNLLTRLTTALDILDVACFLIFTSVFTRDEMPSNASGGTPQLQLTSDIYGGVRGLGNVRIYLGTALPVYGTFFLFDRIYQYLRFGSWTSTYLGIFAREQRQLNPTLPASFPFNGNWFYGGLNSGIIGPLFAPEKSIFLFDPMFPLMLLLTVFLWKRLTSIVRAFLVATFALLAAYIIFYARYIWWAGDFAWGDRYISSAVQLSTLLAVPLLLRYREVLGRNIWRLGLIVTTISIAVQCASLTFWLPLEIYQSDMFNHHSWVVFLRFKNIAAFALGRRQAWGLNTSAMFADPWDAAHITTWNFLPALLRHIGVAPLWVVHLLDGLWLAVGVALVFAIVKLTNVFAPHTHRWSQTDAPHI